MLQGTACCLMSLQTLFESLCIVAYDDDVVVTYAVFKEIGSILGLVELHEYLRAAFATVVLILQDDASGDE